MASNCISGSLPLTEKENVTIFIGTLSSTYYDRLIGHTSASFSNLVQTGERIKTLKLAKPETTRHCMVNHRMELEGQTKRPSPTKRMRKMRKKPPQSQDKHLHTSSPMCILSHLPAACSLPYTSSIFQPYYVSTVDVKNICRLGFT